MLLKNGQIGSAGLDVYEEEEKLFFQDTLEKCLKHDTIARLMNFPKVFITAHPALLAVDALQNVAEKI